MYILNLKDMFSVTEAYYRYLDGKIAFDESGFPIFKKSMFISEWPDLILPYSQRKNWRVQEKSKTVLCFYDCDHHLYPRIAKVIQEIDEYRSYMGVIGMDITITDNMDEEWQEFMFLQNQLFLAVLAINEIKIAINTRSAGLDVSRLFSNVPCGATVASGFLGCDTMKNAEDLSYIVKVLTLLPDKLIIYGKRDKTVQEQLDAIGINYRVYKDFHRLCKEVHHGRQ